MARIGRNNVGGQAPRKLADSKETKAKENQVKNQAKLDAEIKKQAKADSAGTSAADESLPSSPTSSKFLSGTSSFGSTASSASSSAPSTSVSKRITKWLGGYESSESGTPGSSRRSTGSDEIHTASDSSQPSTPGSARSSVTDWEIPVTRHEAAPVEAKPEKKSHLGRNLAIGTAGAAGIAGGIFAAPYFITPGPGDDDPANLPDSAYNAK